ncbi:MAG: cyanophycinase [Fidelibacterota bacterium]
MVFKFRRYSFIFAFVILSLSHCSKPDRPTGHLFIIGGGNRPDYLMEKMISLSNNAQPKVIVIPNASSCPVTTAEYQVGQFKKLGINDCSFLYVVHDSANSDDVLDQISKADILFFSGGDQRRLTADLNGTRLLSAIKERYYNGAVIAGTSAGAAVMSKIMIIGDELINQDSTRSFYTIQKGNIVTTPGFGLIENAIIDQHFITRKRHNRLISLVLENPKLLGIGIDESTAIIVNPDNTFRVFGEHAVIVYDASKATHIESDLANQLSCVGIKMHILTSGQRFDMVKRSVIY